MLSRLVTFYELLLRPLPHNDDKQKQPKQSPPEVSSVMTRAETETGNIAR